MSLIIDITLASPFTHTAYNEAPNATNMPPGPPTLPYIAQQRRHQKVHSKAPGCGSTPFLPFYLTATGVFTPQDLTTLPAYTQQGAHVFGTPMTQASLGGMIGDRPRSLDEALLRRWSRRAADSAKGGTGTFDATLPPALAASRIVSHFYRQLAFDATRATAIGIADAIRSNGIDITVLIPQA